MGREKGGDSIFTQMKTIIFLSAFLLSTAIYAQNKTLKAFYEGYDDTYLFSDADGMYTEFQGLDEKLLKEFDLKGEGLIGKAFLITYTTSEEKDDEGFEFEYNKIISLKPIQLERNEEAEEEDDY